MDSKVSLSSRSGAQKENENKTQRAGPTSRQGPPSSHMIYPQAFAPSTGRRPANAAQSITGAPRPISGSGPPPANRPISAPR